MILIMINLLLMCLKLRRLIIILKRSFDPVLFHIIILSVKMRILFQIFRKLIILYHHPPHLISNLNQIQDFKMVLVNQILIEIIYESLSNRILVRIIQFIILFYLYNGKLLLMTTLWEEYLQRIHMSFIYTN